ncbi:MAG: glycosyl transferase family 2 [Phycisphaerales bacterium]|nr:glycosyl transferase family 2 [Phycisphaerales bacterium]
MDSGSTDQSRQLARSLHTDVVELDLSIPFTAARARNEGFARLLKLRPDVEFVQFLDGDCELRDGWCERAITELNAKPKAAVVCGRRRERFPEASVYNLLCDIEWDTPIGQAASCGGDAMFRVSAFRAAGGYNADIIAGEEPDLCFRLRELHHEVCRIDAEMTWHDAAMTKFSQWWKRNVRAGHAYAEGNARHGKARERFWEKEVKSNKTWGTAALLPFAWPLHTALALKIAHYMHHQRGVPSGAALRYGVATAIGKLPQMLGQRKYYADRKAGRRAAIIEYKGPAKH